MSEPEDRVLLQGEINEGRVRGVIVFISFLENVGLL